MQVIKSPMSLRERIEELLVSVILFLILLIAIAILISPEFARFMAIVLILLAFIALIDWLSSKKR
jgi:glucose-6-phosphate-specific signal transduction histidine kinase